jgi:hypothetical protein
VTVMKWMFWIVHPEPWREHMTANGRFSANRRWPFIRRPGDHRISSAALCDGDPPPEPISTR